MGFFFRKFLKVFCYVYDERSTMVFLFVVLMGVSLKLSTVFPNSLIYWKQIILPEGKYGTKVYVMLDISCF